MKKRVFGKKKRKNRIYWYNRFIPKKYAVLFDDFAKLKLFTKDINYCSQYDCKGVCAYIVRINKYVSKMYSRVRDLPTYWIKQCNNLVHTEHFLSNNRFVISIRSTSKKKLKSDLLITGKQI